MGLFDFFKRRKGVSEVVDAERILWRIIRARQPADSKFRRHAQFDGYVVDFLCPKRRLAVLIAGTESARSTGAVREAHLESHGFRIVVVSADEIVRGPNAVWSRIDSVLREPPPRIH